MAGATRDNTPPRQRMGARTGVELLTLSVLNIAKKGGQP